MMSSILGLTRWHRFVGVLILLWNWKNWWDSREFSVDCSATWYSVYKLVDVVVTGEGRGVESAVGAHWRMGGLHIKSVKCNSRSWKG